MVKYYLILSKKKITQFAGYIFSQLLYFIRASIIWNMKKMNSLFSNMRLNPWLFCGAIPNVWLPSLIILFIS